MSCHSTTILQAIYNLNCIRKCVNMCADAYTHTHTHIYIYINHISKCTRPLHEHLLITVGGYQFAHCNFVCTVCNR
jgi:hypothetical protein